MVAHFSKFLGSDFDTTKIVCLIAGSGLYPILMAQTIRALGLKLVLIAFEDETCSSLIQSFKEEDRTLIKVGQVGKLLKGLRHFEASYVLMAGQIRPKKLFKGMQPDFKALCLLAKLKQRNAESIFGALAVEIEAQNMQLLDARAFMDAHLASPGLMVKAGAIDMQNIDYGVSIAKELARLDIGQGVVVSEGTVIAVEAFEGTNAMLSRAGTLGAKKPLFVKTAKRDQDFRFDVPVVGLQTLEVLSNARIYQVALEASTTLMLEKEKVLQQAKTLGISIWGY